jgi:predicted Zn-dependent peptidase
MRCEHELVREIGTQASLNGTYQPIDDRIKAIDDITAQDVISVCIQMTLSVPLLSLFSSQR